MPNKFSNIMFNRSPLCFKRFGKSFNSTSKVILIIMLTNLVPKCVTCLWMLVLVCGILWNMKNTTTKLPFLLCNKVFPFFSFHGGSSVGNIYGSLLWHFANNVHVKAVSMFGTMWQNRSDFFFFFDRTCVFLYHVKCAMGIHICSSSNSQR
jgi:hypothetical protein